MRYTLGCKIYNKETKTSREGYYLTSKFLPYFSESVDSDKNKYLFVYDSADEINKDIKELARSYRRDDVGWAHQKWEKSKQIITFYPIKIDSSLFPYVLKDACDIKSKQNNRCVMEVIGTK